MRTKFQWWILALVVLGIASYAMNLRLFAVAAICLAVVLIMYLIVTDWSSPAAFTGFFIWIHAEDIARIMGGHFAVFFIKDLLLGALFLGYAMDVVRRKRGRVPVSLVNAIVLYSAIVLIQCLNSFLTNPLIPLVGIHAKLIFISLLFISVAYFDSLEKVRDFLIFVLVAITAECALAIVQYLMDPSWWYEAMDINKEARVLYHRNIGSEQMLKTGSIFITAGRFTQFVIVISLVMIGSRNLLQGNQFQRWLWNIGIIILFGGGIFIQNSRAVLFLFVAGAAVIFLLNRRSRSFSVALPLVTLFFLIGAWATKHVDDNLIEYYIGSQNWERGGYDSVGGRVDRGWLQISNAIADAGFVGFGTGTCSQGLHQITGSLNMPKENGYAALIWEFGVIGPFIWLGMMGSLFLWGLRAYQEVRHTMLGQLALSIVTVIGIAFVLQYIGLQYMENYLVVTHFWCFAGMLIALPRIARESNLKGMRGPNKRRSRLERA